MNEKKAKAIRKLFRSVAPAATNYESAFPRTKFLFTEAQSTDMVLRGQTPPTTLTFTYVLGECVRGRVQRMKRALAK